jgi:hypothetical protein
MTWIVGTPTMFGYGFGISDVRVTLGDDSEIDCLQKIHPVGRFIAAGFAGSVRIGFAMLEAMSERAFCDDETLANDPIWFAETWPEDARKTFAKFQPEEQAHESHLIVISADPQEHFGPPSWARSYVHIFRSPDFVPEIVPVHKIGSIGCGNHYEPCRAAIERFSNDYKHEESVMQSEVGTPGGMGSRIGFGLTRLLMETRPGGISAHLNYCWVYRGQTIIKTNNHSQMGRWSSFEGGSGVGQTQRVLSIPVPQLPPTPPTVIKEQETFHMPPLATTWEGLIGILKSMDAKAELCVA